MVKQVKIFLEDNIDNLQKQINNFCLDFFPEEIFSITIQNTIDSCTSKEKWLGYIVYQREEH